MEYKTTGTYPKHSYLPWHCTFSSSGEGMWAADLAMILYYAFFFLKTGKRSTKWMCLWFIFAEHMKWSIWDLNVIENISSIVKEKKKLIQGKASNTGSSWLPIVAEVAVFSSFPPQSIPSLPPSP